MRFIVISLVTYGGQLVSPSAAAAQRAQTPIVDPTVDRHAAIDSLAALLRGRYVSTDTGQLIADHLLARLRAGAYDALGDMRAFARAATDDLRAINGDKHLSLRYIPGDAPSPSPVGAPPADFGFSRTEVMDGAIGYFRISQFVAPTPEALAALAKSMDALRNVDALIIDVRDTPGGNGGMNDYIWGYLVGPDSVKTMLAQARGAASPIVRWTKPISNPRPRAGIPVFVLTSSHTGSAAEGFSFFLQQSARARTVGETTAGAGHNLAFFSVSPRLGAGISVGRVMYAGNNREWERVGVRPDVSAVADSALSVALAEARKLTRR